MTTRPNSYSSGASTEPLIGETIGANLTRVTGLHPDREALVDLPTGRRWTYLELLNHVDRIAAGLVARGVEAGDRVGVWAPSSPEWLIVQYATARIGAILVSMNPAYRAGEAEFVLAHAGVSVLVAAERFKTSDYRAMIGAVRPNVSALRDVFYIGTPDWEALEDAGAALLGEFPDVVERAGLDLSIDDAINIQYTSGTTGSPKGATLTHHAVLNNGHSIGSRLGYSDGDRVCIPVPFYHCFGMVIGNLAATSHGATIILPERSFDSTATLKAVAEESASVVMGVPTMFIALLADPEFDRFDLSALRVALLGGAPCPAELMRSITTRMGVDDIFICYGMTETAPISMLTRQDDPMEKKVSTVGRVMPHLEVKIVDPETGKTVPTGVMGEFCTRGYSVMKGYWNNAQKTQEVIDEGRWMHSGDLGVMDEEGYVAITGRLKDIIIRGGENIHPREIEELLFTHPDVEDVQVIGIPDAVLGEAVSAWIKLRRGAAPLDAAAVQAFCADRIAHYKVPQHVRIVDAFPMTASGKIRKVEMREEQATAGAAPASTPAAKA